jgi:hypothetical protein
MPKEDKEFFSNNANCYAYSVKCANPTNVPPGMALPGLVTKKSGQSTGDYGEALAAGVLADGGAKVRRLGGTLDAIPAASDGFYLIALLVRSDGFHFIRRQQKRWKGDPIWKWKCGNHGLVYRNVYDTTTTGWVTITNANVASLVREGSRYMSEFQGFEFLCFFEVAVSGFQVSGDGKKPTI